MLPGFIIIGAQKSASTFLHRCIREHPEIYMPKEEDPFFQDPDYLQRDFKDFEAQFDKVPSSLLIGIKRPNYLCEPECSARIYKHIPNVKLIVVLRNPVDRAISSYFHLMRQGFIPIRPLNEGMGYIVKNIDANNSGKDAMVLKYGLYYKALKRYFDLFDRSQLFIRLHSQIVQDSYRIIREVYNFLGVVVSYKPKSLDAQPKKGVYSVWRLQFLQKTNKYKLFNENRTREYPPKDIWPWVMLRLINGIDKFLLAKFDDTRRPKLKPEIKKRLYDFYAKDIEALEKFLKIDLSIWKFNSNG